ncbi:MAG TPA: GNAT family N-acetyltransferase [Mycobacterium sp.]|uniref:GNAT family N-acetyltransferase n=1 Tax=Mycolicibacterium sp. TaxID=2320850 RepID=UPI0025F58679|nr:GNAT family N-acetyltransferase [Mycolicibacterium sp.]HPX36728.1 GNAT family N-acetyltransferase [Mycobacterium sp.]HQC76702.1 GNAT family N-acetyltransferase [Mycobacterium sp.]
MIEFRSVSQDDELARPLLAELAEEYGSRYGDAPERVLRGLVNYPAHEFDPPHGGMLVGLLDSVPVTGGAFRRYGSVDSVETAELKRIWTGSRHRRKGYASLLLDALEAEIIERGYRQVYLTTGHRQPEAEALYLSRGYTRLEAPLSARSETYRAEVCLVPFVKDLTAAGRD